MSDRDRRPAALAAAAALALSSAALGYGCGGGGGSDSTATTAGSTGAATAPKAATTSPAGGGGKAPSQAGGGNDSFRAANFSDPTKVTNEFLPLKPGTQTVRQGFVNVGHRRLPHRVVTTVTDVTKEIDGVRAIALLDQDYNGGEVAEQAIDYLAADKYGAVWSLGSYTEFFEGGQFIYSADAWLAGTAGAKPGLMMRADPRTGTPPYTQEDIPGIAASTAQVVKADQSKCVPFKCYKGVLVIQEGSPSEPGVTEYKYYAPGVGQISTEPRSGSEQEVEDLINFTTLSPRGLAEVSKEVLKQDQHAGVEKPDVFGNAPAAKRTL